MSESVSLGPLALPLAPLLLALACAVGLFVGRGWGRRRGVDPEPVLWRMLLVALLAARLGHVWLWRSAYAEAPWSVLDFRDGGFDPGFGVAGAALTGLAAVRKTPALRAALAAGAGTAFVLWVAGTIGLALRDQPGAPLPALTLQDALGPQAVPLSRFTGQPVVVNLWATWCGPCQREMPVLARAQSRHRDLHFVFANQGEDAARVRAFLAREGLQLEHVLLDPARRVGASFQADALPTTLFFDREGRLVARRIGALSDATLAEQLQRLTLPR